MNLWECIEFPEPKNRWSCQTDACWDCDVLLKSWPCGARNASFWSLLLKCRPEPCSGSGRFRISSGGIQVWLQAGRSCAVPSRCRSRMPTGQSTNYVHGSLVWEPIKQNQSKSLFYCLCIINISLHRNNILTENITYIFSSHPRYIEIFVTLFILYDWQTNYWRVKSWIACSIPHLGQNWWSFTRMKWEQEIWLD